MLKVSSDGTKITGTPQEPLRQETSYSATQTARKSEWYNSYAKFLGATHQQIWDNRNFSASMKEQLALADSILKDFGGDYDKSVGLVNWIGGGGIFKGFWGDRSAWSDQDDFLDVENIVTEGTKRPYKVSDLLIELRGKNPAAHSYIASKAYAKALKIKNTIDSGYGVLNNPTANQTAESMQELADSAAKIPKTIIDATKSTVDLAVGTVEGVSFFARNAYWIVPVTLAGAGYLVYRNRDRIAGMIPQAKMLKALGN